MNHLNTSVALVAIARNEAAYIHEWIHHHLYFGFSHLFIGINRTDDRTLDVIEKISKKHPQVIAQNIDWIDYARPPGHAINEDMQPIAYSYYWDLIQREHGECDYLAYFDVDEFWYPADFKTNIGAFLRKLPDFDIASFFWACQFGDEAAFLPPFADLHARIRAQQKAIINLRTNRSLERMRVHTPLLSDGPSVNHIDANGDNFLPLMGQKATDRPAHPQDAGLLHRMVRSEEEYLALLLDRGFESDVPIKTNRDGFWKTAKKQKLNIAAGELEAYHRSLQSFTIECGIQTLVVDARQSILAKAETILEVGRADLLKNLRYYVQALKGTTAFHQLFEKIAAFQPFTPTECTILSAQLDDIEAVSSDFSSLLRTK
jgi:hypothetical protein